VVSTRGRTWGYSASTTSGRMWCYGGCLAASGGYRQPCLAVPHFQLRCSRLSPETRRRLRAAARRGGTRESDLVRGAVELQLAAEENSLTAYEHAGKAGLIGAVKGIIRDLSTNPEYFDGFGGS